MSDVFVSYSRQDRDVVATIVAALRAVGEDVWVDLEDITPSTLWMDEIKSAIAAADSMVFFLSPGSAHSEVCRTELGHALELSKRIVPVVIQDVQTETVPPPLPDINWLFIQPESFDADVARLVELLNTDIARVHMHTRLLVRANEWMVRIEDSSLLLRGAQLDEASAGWPARPTRSRRQRRTRAASSPPAAERPPAGNEAQSPRRSPSPRSWLSWPPWRSFSGVTPRCNAITPPRNGMRRCRGNSPRTRRAPSRPTRNWR